MLPVPFSRIQANIYQLSCIIVRSATKMRQNYGIDKSFSKNVPQCIVKMPFSTNKKLLGLFWTFKNNCLWNTQYITWMLCFRPLGTTWHYFKMTTDMRIEYRICHKKSDLDGHAIQYQDKMTGSQGRRDRRWLLLLPSAPAQGRGVVGWLLRHW